MQLGEDLDNKTRCRSIKLRDPSSDGSHGVAILVDAGEVTVAVGDRNKGN
jgi:hypothetical protein